MATVLSRGPANTRTVALTFDAGSDRGFAREILDTLANEGVAASFGMTGRWAELNPDLVKRMANEGHDLINHTYDHSSFTGLSTDGKAMPQAQRWSQLDRTEQILAGLTGQSSRPFFRPPYGDYDASVNRDVGARGYAYNVMWTVDSRGWMGLPAQGIVDRCLQMAVPGAIYVFHVGAASADAQALPGIIAGLRAQGYTFARISEYVPQ
jgi:peptidoglycan/xylan/chitin deacetylase (PgdA/CDA1 family)